MLEQQRFEEQDGIGKKIQHKKDFKNIIRACYHLEQAESSKDAYRPIDKEMLLVQHRQEKLAEAYQILEQQAEMTDFDFKKKLFLYQNSVLENEGEEGRRLKDEYNALMCDSSRLVAKEELKGSLRKGLNH